MPSADFFEQFGLLAIRDFVGGELCNAICLEIDAMANAAPEKMKGAVLHQGSSARVYDEAANNRLETQNFEPGLAAEVRKHFLEAMPRVAEHFGIELTDCQKTKFSLSPVGSYFRRHVDVMTDENVPPEIKERKVSVVVFLNEEAPVEKEGAYTGGNLSFYGLQPDSPFSKFGLPLTGERGMLVAFLPTLIHEVTPVTHGKRFVLVNWYI